jgi:hypothetical protein
MIIHLHYVLGNGEASSVEFFSIMDTQSIGNDMFERIEHYRNILH